jgi:L-lactate dehydrogenase complex protein LldE
MVVNHYADLDLTGSFRDDYEALRPRVYELSQFLSLLPPLPEGFSRFPHSVVYHPSCHLTRDLGVHAGPVKFLGRVEGLRLVGEDLPVECCGFGGAFSVKYSALSQRIADRRATALTAIGAEFVTGGDDSCLVHLRQAFRRIGSQVRTIHYARILAGEEV